MAPTTLAPTGIAAVETLGIDLQQTRLLRRRFVYPCLDWSERRPHLGGALGAALLKLYLRKKSVFQELDSRALSDHRHRRTRITGSLRPEDLIRGILPCREVT